MALLGNWEKSEDIKKNDGRARGISEKEVEYSVFLHSNNLSLSKL